MIVLGLDLGTKFPARSTLDLGGRKPVLVGSARGNFAKLPKKERQASAMLWLYAQLVDAPKVVVVEDPRRAIVGLQRDGQTNYPSQSAMLEQFYRITERARAMGLLVITVEPREVISRLGLKLTRGAKPEQRRREKKAQTRRWCEIVLCVRLTEDEADSAAVAFVGGGKVRENCGINKQRRAL